MYKHIEKLKKLGMSSKEAMLFVRSIAQHWYTFGWDDGMDDIMETFPDIEPFDTQFNKSLTPPIKKKK